jgi:hypothetical protein
MSSSLDVAQQHAREYPLPEPIDALAKMPDICARCLRAGGRMNWLRNPGRTRKSRHEVQTSLTVPDGQIRSEVESP